jgi:hypothetical protein
MADTQVCFVYNAHAEALDVADKRLWQKVEIAPVSAYQLRR